MIRGFNYFEELGYYPVIFVSSRSMKTLNTITPDTSNEIFQLAADLVNQTGRNLFLTGKAGTGKTTFIHALCEELGVSSAISSPTFAIINEYSSPVAGTIYHMDWYRLKNEEEAVNAGVEDSLHSGALCLVEWPENAPGLLDETMFRINLEILDPQTRRLFTGEAGSE